MHSKSIARTMIIITSAILVGGCQLINPKTPEVKIVEPSPTPEIYAPLPPLEPATPATPSATPVAKTSTNSTTKGGAVQGATTKVVTKKSTINPLFDTSFDTWEITNFPGQDYEKELTLYNKSDKKVQYSIRANDRYSDTVPVSVNGSYEATGEILPLASTTVKLRAYANDKNPNFTTALAVNFISENNQIITGRTVKIIAHTPIGDRTNLDTHNDADKTGNATLNATYAPNRSYPIRLNNKHSYKVKWTAKFQSSETDGKLIVSAKSGEIAPGGFWDTDIHFTDKEVGSMNQAVLEVSFQKENGDAYETKTVTVNISR